MKRHLTTIVLVIAAIGLGLWLWRDKDRLTTTEQKGREFSAFPAWRKDDVTRIEVVHEGETIVLARANKEAAWRMTAPREERVDQGAAERFTTTLEFATRVRPVGESEASELGLGRPRAAGAVTMGSITYKFTLGNPSPRPEGSSYMKIDDGDAFVVSKEMTEALLASSDTFRDRSVVPYLSLELAKFSVTHADGGFALERLDARSFKVVDSGSSVLASRKALDRAWGALAEMRAESFPKDADVDRLTASPRLTIRMEPKEAGKGTAVLVVGAECPGHPDDVVVLRKEPTRAAACAPKGAIARLLELRPADLRDGAPFGFRHDEIEELRLEYLPGGPSGATIEVARRGTGFHLREPADRELSTQEAEAINELLLASERAPGKVLSERVPFTPIAQVKVRVAEFEETIKIGWVSPDMAVVLRHRDDALISMTPADARRLMPRETTLRPLALMPKETRRVTRVALRCGEDQDFVDAGEGLRMTKPAGYETDGSIGQLVDALTRGKAHEWTADRDDGTFGITPEGCRVVLSFEDGNLPATVRLGFLPEKKLVFGAIDGERGVFVPDAVLPGMMKKIYVSRAAIRVNPTEVKDLTVKVRGKVVPGDLAKRVKLTAAFDDAPVVRLGTVEAVDVELLFTRDDKTPLRVVCAATKNGRHECANPAVKAVFEVSTKAIDDLVAASGTGEKATISDAGTADAR